MAIWSNSHVLIQSNIRKMYIWGTNWEKDYNIVLSMVSTKSEFDGEDGAKEKRVIFYLHKFDVRIFVTIRYHSYILVG